MNKLAIIINESYIIFLNLFSDNLTTVSPGLYSFQFECDLPDNLPTSYEGKFGFIRYVAAVYIKHPLYADKVYVKAFTVIKPHNLNVYPSFRVCTQLIPNQTTYKRQFIKINFIFFSVQVSHNKA